MFEVDSWKTFTRLIAILTWYKVIALAINLTVDQNIATDDPVWNKCLLNTLLMRVPILPHIYFNRSDLALVVMWTLSIWTNRIYVRETRRTNK